MTNHRVDPTKTVERLIKLVLSEQVNCFNCEHCDVEGNACRKFGSQPPLRIIKNGCPEFSQNIPF
ncbi:hypothetical protein D3C81_700870 [compost metagenome]